MESKPRQRLSAEARQEQIVQVAVDLAGERGMQGVTTQDMADAMGLTQGAIFRHFPSKDAIWLAAMSWIRERLMGVLGAAAKEASDPLDALERMFHAHVSFIAKHPAIPRMVFSGQMLHDSPKLKALVQEIVSGYEDRLVALLREAREAGLARADLDEQSAAILFIGMIQGLVVQITIFGAKRSLLEEARKVFPVYLAGIKVERT
ncbi:MAG: TetR family transcriptional regulator [Nitrosomonadales bacterium]|nr:MAG: TetR family transcriptional regulator [Nitrosomonadales bacterium]